MPAVTARQGYLFLAAHPLEGGFSVQGLDIGFFFNFSNDSEAVEFR